MTEVWDVPTPKSQLDRIESKLDQFLELDDLKYRHECLKMMYDDELGFIPPHTVDEAIDDYICEQESHS